MFSGLDTLLNGPDARLRDRLRAAGIQCGLPPSTTGAVQLRIAVSREPGLGCVFDRDERWVELAPFDAPKRIVTAQLVDGPSQVVAQLKAQEARPPMPPWAWESATRLIEVLVEVVTADRNIENAGALHALLFTDRETWVADGWIQDHLCDPGC